MWFDCIQVLAGRDLDIKLNRAVRLPCPSRTRKKGNKADLNRAVRGLACPGNSRGREEETEKQRNIQLCAMSLSDQQAWRTDASA
jgi:hypothetical protein